MTLGPRTVEVQLLITDSFCSEFYSHNKQNSWLWIDLRYLQTSSVWGKDPPFICIYLESTLFTLKCSHKVFVLTYYDCDFFSYSLFNDCHLGLKLSYISLYRSDSPFNQVSPHIFTSIFSVVSEYDFICTLCILCLTDNFLFFLRPLNELILLLVYNNIYLSLVS